MTRTAAARCRVMVLLGTRPEAVKLAPVIRELERCDWADNVVCVTGQHRQLLDQMLQVFDIHPQHDLDVMRDDQGLSETTAVILSRLAPVLRREQPDVLLVQGDTTTSLAGALAAYHLRIPVGHVEAGLRTWRAYEPFPEEIHRQMVARLATWHFAPTSRSCRNLLDEGIASEKVFVTGNTIVDALQQICAVLDEKRRDDAVRLCKGQRLLLVTAHRRESFGEGLRNVCAALRLLVDRNPDLVVAYPVHPNPAVDSTVRELLDQHERIRLLAPIDYLNFVDLMRQARVILTDSGGIQEEAPSLRVPVVVTRTVTERPEGIDAGIARLVGTDARAIIDAVEEWLNDDAVHARLHSIGNPYGDGHAARRIAAVLHDAFADSAHREQHAPYLA